ncbi:MAG: MafB family polymorphic toxin [Cardiobacteriaceae bacterium]|nr:MafB family polymorphic toxin [Cardiobacteriaceae bacterium]
MKKFSAIVKVFLISILLSVNCFADDFRYPESYMPGGEYRLFGSGRGAVSNLTGEYHETGNFAVNAGNIAINNSSYKGHYEYQQDFSGHGHEVHAPFSSSNSKIGLSKKGRPEDGLKISAVYVTGTEVHPADGYDGPQGGGYPEPTGARDEYSYSFKANVTTIKVVSIEKLNQALPPERQITSEEVQKIQNGESLGDERTREIQTVGDTLNPQILGAGEAPPLVSETLGQSDLAVSHGLMFWKDVAVGIGKGAYEKIAETGNSAINSLKDGYSYWQENSLYDIATDGLAWGSEKVVNIREHYSDGVISTTIQDGKNIATGVVNSATNTYNDVKTAYQEGDGEKLGKKIGAGGVEFTIAAATTKGIGAASNATKVINKADDLFPNTNTPLLPKPKYEGTNPWAEGVPIVSMETPKNFYINMAQSPNQKGPGGWGTQDYIPDVNYVRNKLAVTPGFKDEITEVQTYLIPEGIRVQTGTVGPQTHNGVTYPGGGTQVEIYNKQDKQKLIPIGKPRPIK